MNSLKELLGALEMALLEASHSNSISHWGSSNWLEFFKSMSKCELSKWLPRVKTFHGKLFYVISLTGCQVGLVRADSKRKVPSGDAHPPTRSSYP